MSKKLEIIKNFPKIYRNSKDYIDSLVLFKNSLFLELKDSDSCVLYSECIFANVEEVSKIAYNFNDYALIVECNNLINFYDIYEFTLIKSILKKSKKSVERIYNDAENIIYIENNKLVVHFYKGNKKSSPPVWSLPINIKVRDFFVKENVIYVFPTSGKALEINIKDILEEKINYKLFLNLMYKNNKHIFFNIGNRDVNSLINNYLF